MKNIPEGQKTIALFMEFIPRTDLHTEGALVMQAPIIGNETHSACYIANKEDDKHDEFLELKYNTDWNWLMPAWNKVRSTVKPVTKGSLTHNCDNLLTIMKVALYNGDISKAFNALVEIIDWHNTHNS